MKERRALCPALLHAQAEPLALDGAHCGPAGRLFDRRSVVPGEQPGIHVREHLHHDAALHNTGPVTFTGSLSPTGTYQFQTNAGSVNVTIPGTSVFHVDASTDTGSINTTFPGVVVEHHQFTGAEAHSDVGSAPQATITLRTNTGWFNLYQG